MAKTLGCKVGNHTLIDVYISERVLDEVDVVRWCKECGAIVVDTDYDGRTYAGRIMKMRLPNTRNREA